MSIPINYLLQVMICSGILFLYYHLALRNRLFHQWNRFYLLVGVVLSIVLPLMEWKIESKPYEDSFTDIVSTVSNVRSTFEVTAVTASDRFTFSDVVGGLFLFVSACLFVLLIVAILKLLFAVRSNPSTKIGDAYFIQSDLHGTPFSFFHFIFWNREIDIRSDQGQKIAEHELVHVKELHSFDKLFLQVVLIIFWLNPFFWLIRRELTAIHEFIADHKSTSNGGSSLLAELILQSSFPTNQNWITSQFFHSSIKRRIAMITKPRTKTSYFTRMLALPLMALVGFAFTIEPDSSVAPSFSPASFDRYEAKTDTTPGAKKTPLRVDFLRNGKALVYFKDGFEVSKWEWVVADGYMMQEEADQKIAALKQKVEEPLIVFNGEVKEEHTVESSYIFQRSKGAQVKTLKPAEALKVYGERAKHGALVIAVPGSSEVPTPIFTKAERPPVINLNEWRKFLDEKLPEIAKNSPYNGVGITLLVNMKLLIGSDGEVLEAKVVNDEGLGIERPLEKLMLSSPKWQPAEQNGKKVSMYVSQNINITLPGKESGFTSYPLTDPETVKKAKLHQLLGVSESDEVISYTVSMDQADGDIIEIRVSENGMPDNVKKLLESAAKGLVLYIDAILIKKPDGSPRKMPARVYKM